MIDVEPRYLEAINGILKKHVPGCEVRVFGSRVTGKAKNYSDLDLAVVGSSKIERTKLYAMQEEFQESDIPFRVDILDWNAISESFREVINRQYEIIQHFEKLDPR